MEVTTSNILDGAHIIRHHIKHKKALTSVNTTIWKRYFQKIKLIPDAPAIVMLP